MKFQHFVSALSGHEGIVTQTNVKYDHQLTLNEMKTSSANTAIEVLFCARSSMAQDLQNRNNKRMNEMHAKPPILFTKSPLVKLFCTTSSNLRACSQFVLLCEQTRIKILEFSRRQLHWGVAHELWRNKQLSCLIYVTGDLLPANQHCSFNSGVGNAKSHH